MESIRPRREGKIPVKYTDYEIDTFMTALSAGLLPTEIPSDYNEAIKDKEWCKSIEKELTALEDNKTWELVKPPEDINTVLFFNEIKAFFKLRDLKLGTSRIRIRYLEARGVTSEYVEKMNQIKLSLIDYINYIGGNVNGRTVIEGEEVLNAGHIILYGKTDYGPSFIKVVALCLQTSALQLSPHEISGEIVIPMSTTANISTARIKVMVCTCKADAAGLCKHVSAFLILLTRINLAELESISRTELSCSWSNIKSTVQEKYKAVPVKEMLCLQHKMKIPIGETNEKSTQRFILDYFVANLPNSTIAKHRYVSVCFVY
ncbi:hypothetical protein NQ315_016055 [Exocentrus adspersus]|uniref:SWIM-type domain-containing protein n=1 Tax=Exocentrus adspersus TaxID=1586481 RepID=A0AAV8VM11_9CUCU|nr:hypothetical protein NQ315_016055 [Exocentrus adspersus]